MFRLYFSSPQLEDQPNDYFEDEDKLRIVFTAATHHKHTKQRIPKNADIYIHGGSFTEKDDWKGLKENEVPQSWKDFDKYLGEMKHIPTKIIICGKNEIGFSSIQKQEKFEIKKYLSNAIYLQDSSTVVHGVKFYGMPWTEPVESEKLKDAFSAPSYNHLEESINKIEQDVDILITTLPPKGKLDKVFTRQLVENRFQSIGNEALLNKVNDLSKKKLSVHLFSSPLNEGGRFLCEDLICYINGAADRIPYFGQPIVFDYYKRYGKVKIVEEYDYV